MSGKIEAGFIIASIASRVERDVTIKLAELMARQWLADALSRNSTTRFLAEPAEHAAEEIEVIIRQIDAAVEPGAGEQVATSLRYLLHTQIQRDLAAAIESDIYENAQVQARSTLEPAT